MPDTPQTGGETTQAGIRFQNNVAALRFADMLAETRAQSPAGDVVEKVWVEAREPVDDIVAYWKSGRREFIQAKIRIQAKSKPWNKFWSDAKKQFENPEFSDLDEIILALQTSPNAEAIAGLLKRARNATTFQEWDSSLNDAHRKKRGQIADAIDCTNDQLLRLCQACRVWVQRNECPQGTDSFQTEVETLLRPVLKDPRNVYEVLMNVILDAAGSGRELDSAQLWAEMQQRGFQRDLRTTPAPPDSFKRLAPNPYSAGQPVREPALFFGRESTLESIRSTLKEHAANPKRTNAILIYGPFRSGKTSILYQIGHMDGVNVAPLIDCQLFASTASATEFSREFARHAERALEAEALSIPEKAATENAKSETLASAVDCIAKTCRNCRAVILLDEVERLARFPDLMSVLRGLIEHYRKLFFVLATKQDPRWSGDLKPLMNAVDHHLPVTMLSDAELRQLALTPADRYFSYSDGALAKAIKMTGGYPCFAQVLFEAVVEHRNKPEKSLLLVGEEHLAEIAEQAVRNGNNHFANFWEGYHRDCQAMIYELAISGSGESSEEICDRAAERGLRVANPAKAVDQLHQTGLVPTPQNRFELNFDLLADWLRERPFDELFGGDDG